MESKKSLVGMKLPEYSFVVERGKIREFAAAIGDLRDIYLDPQEAAREGYRDVTVPPTFSTVINLWGGMGFLEMCVPLKLNPVRVLHGGQEFEYLGDIVAGDVITVNTTVVDYTEKEKMHVLTLEGTYVNQRNEEVLRSRHIVLELK